MPAGAALYGTILAAYKTLAASYQPGYVNAVIVLTAGVDPPGDISGAQLVHQLSQPYDRRQRIQIIVIMLGQADLLDEVAWWQPWRQSVPIANENRLVVPDTLGTTIKLTSSASRRCPLAWRQQTTARGAGAVTYIRPAVVTCPEIRWPPGACGLADRLPIVTASQGPGGRLRNVSAAKVSQRARRHA